MCQRKKKTNKAPKKTRKPSAKLMGHKPVKKQKAEKRMIKWTVNVTLNCPLIISHLVDNIIQTTRREREKEKKVSNCERQLKKAKMKINVTNFQNIEVKTLNKINFCFKCGKRHLKKKTLTLVSDRDRPRREKKFAFFVENLININWDIIIRHACVQKEQTLATRCYLAILFFPKTR